MDCDQFWFVLDRLTEATHRMRSIRATGGKIKPEHIRRLAAMSGEIKKMTEEYAAIPDDQT